MALFRFGHTRPAPNPEDESALAADLKKLLTTLETRLRRMLATRYRGGPAQAAAATFADLTRELVAFADARAGRLGEPQAAADLRAQADQVAADADELVRDLPRVRSFSLTPPADGKAGVEFRDPSPEAAAHRARFSRMLVGFQALLEGYFALFGRGFRSPQTAAGWSAVADAFVGEVKGLPFHTDVDPPGG